MFPSGPGNHLSADFLSRQPVYLTHACLGVPSNRYIDSILPVSSTLFLHRPFSFIELFSPFAFFLPGTSQTKHHHLADPILLYLERQAISIMSKDLWYAILSTASEDQQN